MFDVCIFGAELPKSMHKLAPGPSLEGGTMALCQGPRAPMGPRPRAPAAD